MMPRASSTAAARASTSRSDAVSAVRASAPQTSAAAARSTVAGDAAAAMSGFGTRDSGFANAAASNPESRVPDPGKGTNAMRPGSHIGLLCRGDIARRRDHPLDAGRDVVSGCVDGRGAPLAGKNKKAADDAGGNEDSSNDYAVSVLLHRTQNSRNDQNSTCV